MTDGFRQAPPDTDVSLGKATQTCLCEAEAVWGPACRPPQGLAQAGALPGRLVFSGAEAAVEQGA